MPSFAGLGKFFGRTASEGAAFAAGVAVAPALSPVVREIVNEANSKYATHPLSPGEAAAIVAEDVEAFGFGRDEASFNGVNETRFRALLGEVLNAPGVGELFQAYRRDLIDDAAFTHGLRKAKLETMWDAPLKALKNLRLDPAVIAAAIQRGIMDDPGFLPVAPPSGAGKVPAFPVSPLDPLAEAQAAGIDRERLFVQTAIQGLPMSLQAAASAYFRRIIELDDYYRAVSEGNTRNEWRDAILEQSRQIPSAVDGVQARLRGWTDDAGMYEQTARHGMSQEDTDLLFKIHGRPPSWHQIWIGLQRGGTFDGPTGDIAAPFLTGLRQSDLRPEWYNLLWHSRYNYPSAFVLRSLTQSGEITEADAREVLLFEGWEPTFAAKVSKAWATAKGAAAKEASAADLLALYEGRRATLAETLIALEALGYPADEARSKVEVLDARRVVSAKTTAIGDLHTKYKKGELSNAATETALASLGVAAWAVPEIVAAWQVFLTAEGGAPPA